MRLESYGIICNQTRLPDELGATGLRFGLQELTRRGGREEHSARAAQLVAATLAGTDTARDVEALASSLTTIAFTWS